MQNDKFKFQTVANTRQMVPAKESKKNSQTCSKKILKLFHTLLEIFLREYTEELFNGYEKYFNVEEIKEYLQKVVNT